jgi:hypothetical protein
MDSAELVVANSTYEANMRQLLNNPLTLSQNLSTTRSKSVAEHFAILSKTGITDVYKSDVTEMLERAHRCCHSLKCNEVTGTIYTVDAGPCHVE